MTRYRLAFAVAKYFEFGGKERDLLRMARECARRGHEVHFFAAAWRGPRPPEIAVHLLNARALTNHSRYRRFARSLLQAVADEGFDCVVGAHMGPGLDVYFAADPCYAAKLEHKRSAFSRLLPRRRALLALEREVFDTAAGTEILLIAHGEREKFIRFHGTPAERFCLLPPGIDRERFAAVTGDRAALRREFGLGEAEYMLLNVGSRFRTKGVDRIVRALAALPADLGRATRLVVVGDDNARPFRRLARSLGVHSRVLFIGGRENLAPFYRSADLLVHPAYTENTGTTLIEAMLCGLAVLATANCGFAFHVERAGAGRVCQEPFTQAAFDRLLAEMLEHERLRQWGNAGLHYCARTDLYSLIPRAADAIIARAERNRTQR